MTTDPTPSRAPINPNGYIRQVWSSPYRISGWAFADHPDGPWRPIPNPQAKPPFPITRYEFDIRDQDGLPVASGDADTLEEAERETRRYLAQYQQDGPCSLKLRRVEVVEVIERGEP